MGNGKSQSSCIETIGAALWYPGSFNAVVRWDQASLKDTTWLLLRQIIAVSGLDPLIKKEQNTNQASRIEFTNGSVIQGFHAKNWQKFGGLPLSSAFIDECSELPDSEAHDQLCARVDRSPIGPNRLWMCGLADGQNWYWKRYALQQLHDHELFRGSTFDNPFLKSDYAQRMVELYGPERAQVMVMGSFDSVEGRLFGDKFHDDVHILRRAHIPKDWPRYCAIDPGYDPDPCAMLRVVVDQQGNIIIDGEYERNSRTTEQWSQDILSINQAHPPEWYVMDFTAWRDTHLSPQCVADSSRRCGIAPLRKAGNNTGYIDQAVALIRSLLTPMPGRIHPLTGQKGTYPQLYIFDDLQHAIKEIKNCRMKKAGAASASKGIKLPDRDHDLVDCLFFLVLESLHPAKADAKPALSEFWQEIHRRQNTSDPVPYLQQVSRIRR
jgi:hypothetical protein